MFDIIENKLYNHGQKQLICEWYRFSVSKRKFYKKKK